MTEISFARYSGLILRHNIDILNREITLSGQITHKTLTKLDKQLKMLELQPDEITIRISTPGGDMEAALGIIDRIRTSPCVINTIGTCIIMSAGLMILVSGQNRKATKYARFMHHAASMGIHSSRMTTVENEVKYCKELERVTSNILATTTKKPYSYWASLGKHIDHYFNAEEALELGIVDEVI